jgi:hypothetical protein
VCRHIISHPEISAAVDPANVGAGNRILGRLAHNWASASALSTVKAEVRTSGLPLAPSKMLSGGLRAQFHLRCWNTHLLPIELAHYWDRSPTVMLTSDPLSDVDAVGDR